MKDINYLGPLACLVILAGCDGEECGEGTFASNGVCRPALSTIQAPPPTRCRPGQVLEGVDCVPTAQIDALDEGIDISGFGQVALRRPRRDASGPAFVLFHGIYGGVSHRAFLELTRALDARGARVYLLDLVGVGKSDKRAFERGQPAGVRQLYTSRLIAEFVETFVREAISEPVALVAETSGAMAVLEASTRLGAQVQDVVLLSPTGVNVQSSPPSEEQNTFFSQLSNDPNALQRFYQEDLLSDENIRDIVEPGYFEPSVVSEAVFDEYRLGRDVENQWWISLSFTSGQIFSRFGDIAPNISSRVLLVFGANDVGVVQGAGPGEGTVLLAEPDRESDFRAIAPDLDYLTLDRLGQIFWKEQPQLVAEILLSRNR